jgi:hypothetical protein
VELRIPRLRRGSYFPGFLEPRRMAEKALTAFAIVSRTMYGWLLLGKEIVIFWRLVGSGHVYGVEYAA